MENTKISYTYCDASGYKTFSDQVLCGKLSEEDELQLRACMESREFFIPGQVGLPAIAFDTFTGDDHPWFTLDGLTPTNDPATLPFSLSELKDKFQAVKGNWNSGVNCWV